MDLFGKKARQAQAHAEGQLAIAREWIEFLQAQLTEFSIQEVLNQGALDRLSTIVNEKTLEVQDLRAQLSARPKPVMRATPLYKSEEEEELEYALRNGDIDMNEFKSMMAQLGFENAEVELPGAPVRPLIN